MNIYSQRRVYSPQCVDSWTNRRNSERNKTHRNLRNTMHKHVLKRECRIKQFKIICPVTRAVMMWWCRCALIGWCVCYRACLDVCVYIYCMCVSEWHRHMSAALVCNIRLACFSLSLTVSCAFQLPLSVPLLFQLVTVEVNVFSFCQACLISFQFFFLSPFITAILSFPVRVFCFLGFPLRITAMIMHPCR